MKSSLVPYVLLLMAGMSLLAGRANRSIYPAMVRPFSEKWAEHAAAFAWRAHLALAIAFAAAALLYWAFQ